LVLVLEASSASQQTTSQTSTHSTTQKSGASHKTSSKAATAHKKKPASHRVIRLHQAFVASSSLKPMAQQLIQDRTPAAYAGVQSFATSHANEDAGALAWLVLGYAHILDHDYSKAIEALNRARPRAGDLGDYVAYYLGESYLQTGRTAEAVATLADFGKNYPDSLQVREAHLAYAEALLAEGRPKDAVALLERYRQPLHAEVEMALAKGYQALGENNKAADAYRNVYYGLPTSSSADQAGSELRKLGATAASNAERRARAEALEKGKRYGDAANEYRELADQAAPAERPAVLIAMAMDLQKSGRSKEAKQALASMPETSGEANALRLYTSVEIARSSDDPDGVAKLLDEMRRSAASSPWFEQALLSAANMSLLKHDYDRAIETFRELSQRFPSSSKAAYGHWKAAWLSFREGRTEDAKKAFDEQIELYPASGEVPAALYWNGRIAEEQSDEARAYAYYQKLSGRYRNYYYALLARQRLANLKKTSGTVRYPALERVSPPGAAKITEATPPADDLRFQKAQLLANGGLVDLAVKEVQAGGNGEKASWIAPEAARIYRESGRYDRSLETMKRAVPDYFAKEIPDMPQSYWTALFPKPYWNDLKNYSTQNGLDPFLVASLIRQESEFNPAAISHANAIGLMQLLPKTGKMVAKEVKLKSYSVNRLVEPGVNLELGTRYFRGMVDKFGAFEYALAAYNAGDDRVKDWLEQGKYRDVQEFVESIPFTETREYVQAIVRNANVYKLLYGQP
jgi:soluble lytic murein transglycosylase